jgi:PBP1b-binding outer membrane lipoprotein LpoB
VKKFNLTLSVVIMMLLISACSGVSETVTEVPPTPTVFIEPVETDNPIFSESGSGLG